MTGVTDQTRHSLVRLVLLPGWVVLATVTAAFALGATLQVRYQFVPLVASVVLVGLPHGAVDHLTPSQARQESPSPRSLAAVGVLYAIVGGIYAVVWFLTPVAAMALFILVTWLHWGQGEVHALLAIADVEHLQTTGQRVLTALGRGAVTMLVPLVAFPEQYKFVVERLVGLFVAPGLGPFSVLFTLSGRVAVGLFVGTLLTAGLASGYLRATKFRGWALDAGETLLLVVFFSLVPPILAVGLYFNFWHSLRHVGRLLELDPVASDALASGNPGRAVGRFLVNALPMTAGALVFLGLLYVVVPANPSDIANLVALYLVLIAVLTLPHVLVVTDLDRQQAVWTPDSTD